MTSVNPVPRTEIHIHVQYIRSAECNVFEDRLSKGKKIHDEIGDEIGDVVNFVVNNSRRNWRRNSRCRQFRREFRREFHDEIGDVVNFVANFVVNIHDLVYLRCPFRATIEMGPQVQ